MSGNFWLDWAVLSLSIFNTAVLTWLGLTVLLNAEHRRLGIWLTASSLLMGGLFFLSHSVIVGEVFELPGWSLDLWWQVGWAPVVYLPFAWYGIILWYSGFWSQPDSMLRRRHQAWLVVTLLLAVGITGSFFVARVLPSAAEVLQMQLNRVLSIQGVPLLLVIYPVYAVLCTGLSFDAIRSPAPSQRVMGELARLRARPWLTIASLSLFGVSLLVGGTITWVVVVVLRSPYQQSMPVILTTFDLTIQALIALSVLLVGQAIVSYEVFTGRVLPRRGLKRYWSRVVILACGLGGLVAWGVLAPLPPIYSLLVTVLLATVFYALLSWRSFAERENAIQSLRPFVASQRLYERLLVDPVPETMESGARTYFQVLCEEVLGVRRAYLVGVGALGPLAGSPLAYPASAEGEIMLNLPLPGTGFDAPGGLCTPVDPEEYAGASWAVPLWNERGLVGVLYLGEKRDGSLYTQEEIEISRAVAEKVLDIQAGSEMAQRLMALQRQRVMENQVIDRRARRTLHDEVLPQLHAALLLLNGLPHVLPITQQEDTQEALTALAEAHAKIANLLQDLPPVAAPELARQGLGEGLRHLVEVEGKVHFEQVAWQVSPAAEERLRLLPPVAAEVVFYAAREAVRNAARHGRGGDPARPLSLVVNLDWQDGLWVMIEDNGVGLPQGEAAGQASAESNGQGLALHSTLMAVLGGSLTIESAAGSFTRVILFLPEQAWGREQT
jgi:signal transduction histidine kinase